MNENKVISAHQGATENSSMSVLLNTPKQEFQLGSQASTIFPPSAYSNHCDLTAEAINCSLPATAESPLEVSHLGIGSENQAGDISLGSESFLQSLESIPLPPLVQNETTLYNNPLSTYSEPHANASEAKYLSCPAAMQQELLHAWGSAGPPMNSNSSPGGGFVQVPFAPGESPVVVPPRCLTRAVRSRGGRGRGLRRKFTVPPNPQGRLGPASRPSFSPRRGLPMRRAGGIRAETLTTPAQSYLPISSNPPLPAQNQASSLSSRDAAERLARTCNCRSSETVPDSEENQANEKMNAYIEKFSRESCDAVGSSSVAIDTSRKPNTLQEAISMYIDFLVLENEKRTRISCCNVLPIPLDFHKEDYYHEIMYQPIAFPTPKFRDWLRLYSVDIEITDPDGQTVSQTTFPPSGNFADASVSIPTSMHMINWHQTRGVPTQPRVVSSPRFNVPAVYRGRPKSRAFAGHALRLGQSSFKGVASHPFEFVQSSPADRATDANVQYLRGNVPNYTNAQCVSPCGGAMHPFQTISLPALGSIQYMGQAPQSVSVPRPCPEVFINNSPQMISSLQHAASAKPSSCYRMAPVFSPGCNDMAWKSCCSRPSVLLPDFKATGFTEMETENMAACLNRLETGTSADNTTFVPSVIGMLPPFSSFSNGSCSANQCSESGVKTREIGETAAGDNLQNLSFAREVESANVSSFSSVAKNSCISFTDSGAATQRSPGNSRFNWTHGRMYGRPGSGPVIKEMVDQGCQTELEEEDPKASNAGTAVLEGQGKEREFELDSAVCSFSCNEDSVENRKTEDQLNSEILLRNASIILNGSLEVEESIQTPSFASQELLSNSQASTLGDLDGLALCEDCGIQSFMTVNLSCSSEDPEKASSESRSSGGDSCNNVECNETPAETDCLHKSSDLMLEVGSNVEINTEGEATVGERWTEPKRKRARFSKVGNRQLVAGGQDPWPNICFKLQRRQTADQDAGDAPAFENGKESVNGDHL